MILSSPSGQVERATNAQSSSSCRCTTMVSMQIALPSSNSAELFDFFPSRTRDPGAETLFWTARTPSFLFGIVTTSCWMRQRLACKRSLFMRLDSHTYLTTSPCIHRATRPFLHPEPLCRYPSAFPASSPLAKGGKKKKSIHSVIPHPTTSLSPSPRCTSPGTSIPPSPLPITSVNDNQKRAQVPTHRDSST